MELICILKDRRSRSDGLIETAFEKVVVKGKHENGKKGR